MIEGEVLELKLNLVDGPNPNLELMLNVPLWVFCHLFAGWTTPDMLIHHVRQSDIL